MTSPIGEAAELLRCSPTTTAEMLCLPTLKLDPVTSLRQHRNRALQVALPYHKVVGVLGRHHEYVDVGFGYRRGDGGNHAGKVELKRALDLQAPPAGLMSWQLSCQSIFLSYCPSFLWK
jgi:hypothetical protein